MSHEIDFSNQRENMAYVGREPWHGLGHRLTENADLATWRREAGLEWEVLRSQVRFEIPKQTVTSFSMTDLVDFKGRDVLYRSDTFDPLSVVSTGYRIVQPADIFEFFRELTEIGGFQMETAGSLSGGKRIWALAKVGDGVEVADRDVVKPYVLMATSFDGTLATVAKFTSVRVVCQNTLQMSTGGFDGRMPVRGEDETVGTKAVSAVRVVHSEKWDPERARQDLGIIKNAWDRFIIDARALAGRTISDIEMDAFLVELIRPYTNDDADKARKSKGYNAILKNFCLGETTVQMVGSTRWAALNAVTEYVDHERGNSPNTRLEAAWFGAGASLKERAAKLLAEA